MDLMDFILPFWNMQKTERQRCRNPFETFENGFASGQKCVTKNWSDAIKELFRSFDLTLWNQWIDTIRLQLWLCLNLFIHTRCQKVAIGHAINEAAATDRPPHFQIKRSIRSAWSWARPNTSSLIHVIL